MKSRLLGVMLVAISCFSIGINASVIYSYTGNNYTSVTGASFDTSMRITGYLEFGGLLAPNLVDANITPTSFSFSDGVSTIPPNPPIQFEDDIFRLWTDSSANIVNWHIVIDRDFTGDGPNDIGETKPIIETIHRPQPDAFTLDLGQLATCVQLDSLGTCTFATYEWGRNQSNQGSWTIVPVSATVWLFTSGLLGVISIARRKPA